MNGDFFIGSSLASTLTKLALRYGNLASPIQRNRFDAQVMLIMTGIVHLGKSGKINNNLLIFMFVCVLKVKVKSKVKKDM